MKNVIITVMSGQLVSVVYDTFNDKPHTTEELKRRLIQNASNITDVIYGKKIYSYVPNSFKRIRECNYSVTHKLKNADIILCELNPVNYTRNKMFSRITIGYNIYKDINILKNSIGWCDRISEFIPIVNKIEELFDSKQLCNIIVDVDVKHYFDYHAGIHEIFHNKKGDWIFDIYEDIDIDKLFPIEYFVNLTAGIIINDEVFESIKEQLSNKYNSTERDIIYNIIDTCNLLHSIRYVIRLVTEGFVSSYSLPIIKKKCGELAYSRDDFESAIRMMQKTHTLTTDNLNWACQYYTKKKKDYTIEFKPSDELIELAKQTTQEVSVLLNQVHEDSESCEFPHTQCDNDPQ